MKKIILLFSHTLTEPQRKELIENWNCDEIIYMPNKLKNNWMNVVDDVDVNQFKKFLLDNLQKGDYVLIQGEWGLTYNMINFAKENNFTSVTLDVWNFNESALKFYEKIGFLPLKTLMEKQI